MSVLKQTLLYIVCFAVALIISKLIPNNIIMINETLMFAGGALYGFLVHRAIALKAIKEMKINIDTIKTDVYKELKRRSKNKKREDYIS